MKTTRAINFWATMLLAFGLILAPLAAHARAQNTSTTQSGQSTQSGGASTQSSRQTTTTTQQSQPTTTSSQTTTTTTARPAETTNTSAQTANGIDPLWIIIGVVALLAILLIAILSMRGRSRGNDTVVERKTTVKKE